MKVVWKKFSHKRGMSIQAIAKEFGISRNTVRRIVAPPRYFPRPAVSSMLDDFRPYIQNQLESLITALSQQTAEQEWSYVDFLERLLNRPVVNVSKRCLRV
ncbi:TPA: helix-turn-helix domain-containing protein [Klebsiella aerogenes]|nr:helix-turn-helix domain-containing protein [Klebsiella aerogenes]